MSDERSILLGLYTNQSEMLIRLSMDAFDAVPEIGLAESNSRRVRE